ncbi:MAG: UDP-N-acetylmuramoyl-tripeptide--D-alanyl-D-alanine ligase [Planctomycetaceae bacterium]
MTKFTLNDLLEGTGGSACGFSTGDVVFHGIGIDSRTIKHGELFWAIPGEKHDGHNFIDDAIRKGATACVVGEAHGVNPSAPRVIVPDSLEALKNLAAWHRRRHDILTIGITGSFGKTTTREMIYAVLSTEFSGIQSQKNFNNHIGLPLSLLEIQQPDEFAVLEMGASHLGEIRELADIAMPEIGIVTGIGLAHLEGFGSLEHIIQAKGELLESLPASGFAVLNGDDPLVREMASRASCPVIFVGEGKQNTFQVENVIQSNETLNFFMEGTEYSISVTGKHHVQAAMVAIAVGRELGMKSEAIAEGLRSFVPVAGRCRLETIGPWHVIDDTYNANPASMRAACETLKHWKTSGAKILVVGDMLELGQRASECHRELGRVAADAEIDQLIVLGSHAADVIQGALEAGMKSCQLAECSSFETLTTILDCWCDAGDVVLVKGSRGMKMERVIQWMKQQYENSLSTVDSMNSHPRRMVA